MDEDGHIVGSLALGDLICGCCDDSVKELVVAFLRDVRAAENYPRGIVAVRAADVDTLYHAVACWLDLAGLLEHGVAIRGSWLTEKGKALLTRTEEDTHAPP